MASDVCRTPDEALAAADAAKSIVRQAPLPRDRVVVHTGALRSRSAVRAPSQGCLWRRAEQPRLLACLCEWVPYSPT
jgi:hypothetical protein